MPATATSVVCRAAQRTIQTNVTGIRDPISIHPSGLTKPEHRPPYVTLDRQAKSSDPEAVRKSTLGMPH
jgi:hypothetical protein